MRFTWEQLEALSRKAGATLCTGLAATHGGTAWLLARVGRPVGRFLSWLPWSCRLGGVAALLACLSLQFFVHAENALIAASDLSPEHIEFLRKQGWVGGFHAFCLLGFAVGLVLSLAAAMAFVRRRLSFLVLRLGAVSFAAWWCGFLFFLLRIPGVLFAANDKTFDKGFRNDLWIHGALLWLGPLLVAGVYLLGVSLRAAREHYGGRPGGKPLLGDRIIENLRTHGGDPTFRTSLYWVLFLHVFFIVILPLLLTRGFHMDQAYGVPLGSGTPTLGGGNPVVKMIKVKAPKKQKTVRFVLNVNSPISFYRPDFEDSKRLQELDQASSDQYVATSFRPGSSGSGSGGVGGTGKGGKLGAGGGTRGGWPNGMEGAKVRFIRLEYQGGDWDQDMGVGADYNMLIEFHKITSFKIADNTESITIPQLRRFPKHRGPPFVFLTGKGNIAASRKDVETLRWYCTQEGGLIFADNGGGSFNQSFRALMRRAFPELEWVDISNDDILFQQPFIFPSGAPPLWHHSGDRALGLKHNGRWVVFYHQGDLNDAWKTGHSGATENQAMQAYRLGTNIINYAFNQYMSIHYGD